MLNSAPQRPFPLKGRFYANIFIHFEPTGEHLYDNEWDEVDDFYPPYLVSGSPWTQDWEKRNPTGWKKSSPSMAAVEREEGHAAAGLGDLDSLKDIAASNKRALHAKDKNGWVSFIAKAVPCFFYRRTQF